MTIQSNRANRGLTLIELMVTLLAAMVLIVGVSAMLYHGHVGYSRLFRRVNSEVVRNAYEARRTFDRIVRRSSIRRCDLADGNNTAYVYYFTNPQDVTIKDPDRYAKFYVSGTQLRLEQGNVQAGTFGLPLPGRTATGEMPHAQKVTAPGVGIFSRQGNAVRMVLILDNETSPPPGVTKIETVKMTVASEAMRHNW